MSSYLTPEDAPFVFGAFASVLQQSERPEPVDVIVDQTGVVTEDGVSETVVEPIAS